MIKKNCLMNIYISIYNIGSSSRRIVIVPSCMFIVHHLELLKNFGQYLNFNIKNSNWHSF